MMRLAVLASHEGSTLQALIDACAAQTLEAEVVLVVSNNSKAGALRRAVAANIDTRHISIKTHGSEAAAKVFGPDARNIFERQPTVTYLYPDCVRVSWTLDLADPPYRQPRALDDTRVVQGTNG